MKSLLLGLLGLFLLTGCNQIRYVSISKSRVDTSSTNQYIVTEKQKTYEGNSSVSDINNKSSKHDTIVIEDDGTYYYTH